MKAATTDLVSVTLSLKNVLGDYFNDTVRFYFKNLKRQSLTRRFSLTLHGETVRTPATIAAGAHGQYQVFITPERYREKSILFRVPLGKPAGIEETFLLEPSKANPRFPSYKELETKSSWTALINVMKKSGITATQYSSMDDQVKAGIFNLHAKMQRTTPAAGSTVFDHVEKITRPKPARFYAHVSRDLYELVSNAKVVFRSVSGALHSFFGDWKPIAKKGSFKTRDEAGNLQLTFARNVDGDYLVDADIDDHDGLEHAFDVLKHTFTKRDTHPYDIHQILVLFQGLHPGYDLE